MGISASKSTNKKKSNASSSGNYHSSSPVDLVVGQLKPHLYGKSSHGGKKQKRKGKGTCKKRGRKKGTRKY
jgi:hypothetical protein